MDKRGRWVEDSVHNTRRVIWANGNVLWIDELTSNFSDYDEWNPIRSH